MRILHNDEYRDDTSSSYGLADSDDDKTYAPASASSPPVAIEQDRRANARVRTVYRITPVKVNGERGLARLRNISDGGMRLDMAMPVMLGDRASITLSTSQVLEGRVVWTNGGECGVQFDEPIDSYAALCASYEEARAPGARAPRLPTNTPAVAESDQSVRPVKLCDISQRGMKIAHDGSFIAGLPVRITLPSGVQRRGVVRWSKDGYAGVMLSETFSPTDLGQVSRL